MEHEHRRALATSYLDHLLIAIEAADRGAPFRTFLDNWYAYEVGGGHLTRGGRPIWFNNPCAVTHQAALASMHFRSEAAARVLAQASVDPAAYRRRRAEDGLSVRLMVDHAVPLRVLVQAMFDDPTLRTREALRRHLLDNYRLGVITSEEDAILRHHGLTSAMPNPWCGSPFARYTHARIACAR